MSKKTSKKRTSSSARSRARSKEVAPEHELPGGFWRQVLAVLMLVLAVVFIFNWLGDGGPVLQMIDEGIYYGIGGAEFLIPAILVWLAVKIFRSEDNRIPAVMWVTSLLMLVWVAGLTGVSSYGTAEANGGVVGTALNDAMFQIGNAGVAIFIYVVLIFVTTMFILQMNPVTVFRAIGRMFNTSAKEEKKAAKLAVKEKKAAKGKAVEESGERDGRIKVNKGVAIDEEEAENEKPLVPLKAKLGMMGKLGRGAEKEEARGKVEKVAAVPGKVVYEPNKGVMYCPHCDGKNSEDRIDNSSMTQCINCGAPIAVKDYTSACRCEHCGSYLVLNERVEGMYEPHMILPFRICKEAAVGSLEWEFSNRLFTPSDFMSAKSLEKMEGIYVPFWLYDYNADCNFLV